LRAMRLASGLTQAELARRLFTDQTTVSAWELDKVAPSGAALAALCLLFQVGRRALEDGEDFDPTPATLPLVISLSPEYPSPLGLPDLSGAPAALLDLRIGKAELISENQIKTALTRFLKEGRPLWLVAG